MALLQQWRSRRSWAVDSIIALGGATIGITGLMPALIPPIAEGTISSPSEYPWEHPVRAKILTTLEKSPGLHFRELQRRMNAANGTLRHHLDVLVNEKTVTIIPVNGRTCYFAGGPAQVEILQTMSTSQEIVASSLPIGLSTVQQQIVDDILDEGTPRTQAELARRIGRSRASVHSAVKVLRRRGILRQDRLEIGPHIEPEIFQRPERLRYQWDDGRQR